MKVCLEKFFKVGIVIQYALNIERRLVVMKKSTNKVKREFLDHICIEY